MSSENVASTVGGEITKVFCQFDDDETPYVMTLTVPPEKATLGLLKKAIPRKVYSTLPVQYYSKVLDPDIQKEVKVELTDDTSALLKSENGTIQVYVNTVAASATLPRKQGNKAGPPATLSRRQPSAFPATTEHFRKRRSFTVVDEMGASTVLSGRAGEQLADIYTSNSDDPYSRYDMSRASSSLYDHAAERYRQRKPRKSRRKPYVPSTIGSAPESSGTSMSLPHILEVRVALDASCCLGISVVTVDGSILISDIDPLGAVARSHSIDVGDQIVQVNNHSFENLSDRDAIQILRQVAAAKRPLTLLIAKRSVRNESAPDALSALASDQTMPLDISVWVENAVHCTERQRYGLDEPSEAFEEGSAVGSSDDEEERRLYAERRHGTAVARLPDDALRINENDFNQRVCLENLHSKMDLSLLVAAMRRPESGLVVKNRKWLKIPVPNSFIGRELVDWLLLHVKDIDERRQAREVASRLLAARLIRHVVSKEKFTEKCYYVFQGNPNGSRNYNGDTVVENAQPCGGPVGRVAEGATEVSYVASPPIPPVRLLQDETWPISPITTLFPREGMAARRADCESEYASMVGESVVEGSLAAALRAPPPNTPLSLSRSLPPPSDTDYDLHDDRRRIMRA